MRVSLRRAARPGRHQDARGEHRPPAGAPRRRNGAHPGQTTTWIAPPLLSSLAKHPPHGVGGPQNGPLGMRLEREAPDVGYTHSAVLWCSQGGASNGERSTLAAMTPTAQSLHSRPRLSAAPCRRRRRRRRRQPRSSPRQSAWPVAIRLSILVQRRCHLPSDWFRCHVPSDWLWWRRRPHRTLRPRYLRSFPRAAADVPMLARASDLSPVHPAGQGGCRGRLQRGTVRLRRR